MRPTLNTVRVDRALTNFATNYRPQQYVAGRILPFFNVNDQSGIIWQVNQERMAGKMGAAFTGNELLRAEDGSSTPLGGYRVAQGTYRTEEHSQHEILFDKVLKGADPVLSLRQQITQALTESQLRHRELRTVTLVTTAGNFPAGHKSNGADWSVVGTELRTDVDIAKTAIRKARLGGVAIEQLKLVISWDLWQLVRNNTALKASIQYVLATTGGNLNPALLAQYLDIGEVIVAGAYYDAAERDLAASITQFFPITKALIFVAEPASTVYNGFGQAYSLNSGGFLTRSWRDDPRKGEIIEVDLDADEKIVNSDAGYLLTGLDA